MDFYGEKEINTTPVLFVFTCLNSFDGGMSVGQLVTKNNISKTMKQKTSVFDVDVLSYLDPDRRDRLMLVQSVAAVPLTS